MTQTYTQVNSQNSNTQQQIEQNEQIERQSKNVQIKEKKQQKKETGVNSHAVPLFIHTGIRYALKSDTGYQPYILLL